ncbi:hypothetical protein DFJ73DRAFT_592943 [Zopfochytrium polystomum]|nr:hypothetical protein DFJ73DRAFT_592943 [Zopfochytrium polystomum]
MRSSRPPCQGNKKVEQKKLQSINQSASRHKHTHTHTHLRRELRALHQQRPSTSSLPPPPPPPPPPSNQHTPTHPPPFPPPSSPTTPINVLAWTPRRRPQRPQQKRSRPRLSTSNGPWARPRPRRSWSHRRSRRSRSSRSSGKRSSISSARISGGLGWVGSVGRWLEVCFWEAMRRLRGPRCAATAADSCLAFPRSMDL